MGVGDNFDTGRTHPSLKNLKTGRNADMHGRTWAEWHNDPIDKSYNAGHPCNKGCGCQNVGTARPPNQADSPGCFVPPELVITVVQSEDGRQDARVKIGAGEGDVWFLRYAKGAWRGRKACQNDGGDITYTGVPHECDVTTVEYTNHSGYSPKKDARPSYCSYSGRPGSTRDIAGHNDPLSYWWQSDGQKDYTYIEPHDAHNPLNPTGRQDPDFLEIETAIVDDVEVKTVKTISYQHTQHVADYVKQHGYCLPDGVVPPKTRSKCIGFDNKELVHTDPNGVETPYTEAECVAHVNEKRCLDNGTTVDVDADDNPIKGKWEWLAAGYKWAAEWCEGDYDPTHCCGGYVITDDSPTAQPHIKGEPSGGSYGKYASEKHKKQQTCITPYKEAFLTFGDFAGGGADGSITVTSNPSDRSLDTSLIPSYLTLIIRDCDYYRESYVDTSGSYPKTVHPGGKQTVLYIPADQILNCSDFDLSLRADDNIDYMSGSSKNPFYHWGAARWHTGFSDLNGNPAGFFPGDPHPLSDGDEDRGKGWCFSNDPNIDGAGSDPDPNDEYDNCGQFWYWEAMDIHSGLQIDRVLNPKGHWNLRKLNQQPQPLKATEKKQSTYKTLAEAEKDQADHHGCIQKGIHKAQCGSNDDCVPSFQGAVYCKYDVTHGLDFWFANDLRRGADGKPDQNACDSVASQLVSHSSTNIGIVCGGNCGAGPREYASWGDKRKCKVTGPLPVDLFSTTTTPRTDDNGDKEDSLDYWGKTGLFPRPEIFSYSYVAEHSVGAAREGAIEFASNTKPIIIKSTNHRLRDDDLIEIKDVMGNFNSWIMTNAEWSEIQWQDKTGKEFKGENGHEQKNPHIVCKSNDDGSCDYLKCYDAEKMSGADAPAPWWVVKVLDNDHFSLYACDGVTPSDGTIDSAPEHCDVGKYYCYDNTPSTPNKVPFSTATRLSRYDAAGAPPDHSNPPTVIVDTSLSENLETEEDCEALGECWIIGNNFLSDPIQKTTKSDCTILAQYYSYYDPGGSDHQYTGGDPNNYDPCVDTGGGSGFNTDGCWFPLQWLNEARIEDHSLNPDKPGVNKVNSWASCPYTGSWATYQDMGEWGAVFTAAANNEPLSSSGVDIQYVDQWDWLARQNEDDAQDYYVQIEQKEICPVCVDHFLPRSLTATVSSFDTSQFDKLLCGTDFCNDDANATWKGNCCDCDEGLLQRCINDGEEELECRKQYCRQCGKLPVKMEKDPSDVCCSCDCTAMDTCDDCPKYPTIPQFQNCYGCGEEGGPCVENPEKTMKCCMECHMWGCVTPVANQDCTQIMTQGGCQAVRGCQWTDMGGMGGFCGPDTSQTCENDTSYDKDTQQCLDISQQAVDCDVECKQLMETYTPCTGYPNNVPDDCAPPFICEDKYSTGQCKEYSKDLNCSGRKNDKSNGCDAKPKLTGYAETCYKPVYNYRDSCPGLENGIDVALEYNGDHWGSNWTQMGLVGLKVGGNGDHWGVHCSHHEWPSCCLGWSCVVKDGVCKKLLYDVSKKQCKEMGGTVKNDNTSKPCGGACVQGNAAIGSPGRDAPTCGSCSSANYDPWNNPPYPTPDFDAYHIRLQLLCSAMADPPGHGNMGRGLKSGDHYQTHQMNLHYQITACNNPGCGGEGYNPPCPEPVECRECEEQKSCKNQCNFICVGATEDTSGVPDENTTDTKEDCELAGGQWVNPPCTQSCISVPGKNCDGTPPCTGCCKFEDSGAVGCGTIQTLCTGMMSEYNKPHNTEKLTVVHHSQQSGSYGGNPVDTLTVTRHGRIATPWPDCDANYPQKWTAETKVSTGFADKNEAEVGSLGEQDATSGRNNLSLNPKLPDFARLASDLPAGQGRGKHGFQEIQITNFKALQTFNTAAYRHMRIQDEILQVYRNNADYNRFQYTSLDGTKDGNYPPPYGAKLSPVMHQSPNNSGSSYTRGLESWRDDYGIAPGRIGLHPTVATANDIWNSVTDNGANPDDYNQDTFRREYEERLRIEKVDNVYDDDGNFVGTKMTTKHEHDLVSGEKIVLSGNICYESRCVNPDDSTAGGADTDTAVEDYGEEPQDGPGKCFIDGVLDTNHKTKEACEENKGVWKFNIPAGVTVDEHTCVEKYEGAWKIIVPWDQFESGCPPHCRLNMLEDDRACDAEWCLECVHIKDDNYQCPLCPFDGSWVVKVIDNKSFYIHEENHFALNPSAASTKRSTVHAPFDKIGSSHTEVENFDPSTNITNTATYHYDKGSLGGLAPAWKQGHEVGIGAAINKLKGVTFIGNVTVDHLPDDMKEDEEKYKHEAGGGQKKYKGIWSRHGGSFDIILNAPEPLSNARQGNGNTPTNFEFYTIFHEACCGILQPLTTYDCQDRCYESYGPYRDFSMEPEGAAIWCSINDVAEEGRSA